MNLEKIRTRRFDSVTQDYTIRDTMLYALGLGYGAENPLDPKQLRYVFEKDLKAVPSMCVVLGYPGFWLGSPEVDVNWVKMLHGEHFFEIHRPLKPAGKVRAEHRVPAVEDKGEGKGALLYIEKRLFDEDDQPLATILQTMFLRGDGGFGGYGEPPKPPAPLPETAPDSVVEIDSPRNQALIYRLSGDYNPLHADPEVAKKAGFPEPILHGLCSMGMATRTVIDQFCDGDSDRLKSLYVRFSKPVFPGETIRYSFYKQAGGVRFRAQSVQRDIVVLDRCEATFS